MRKKLFLISLAFFFLSTKAVWAVRSIGRSIFGGENTYIQIMNEGTVAQTIEVLITAISGTISTSNAIGGGVNVVCPTATLCKLDPNLKVLGVGKAMPLGVVTGMNPINVRVNVQEDDGALSMEGSKQIVSGSHIIWPIIFDPRPF